MDLIEIAILAVVQGITEFLPVSSSGHVVVLAALFDQWDQKLQADDLTVNIVLHLGTLLAILVFYWRRIVELLGRDRRVIGLLAVGSIPAASVGMTLKAFDLANSLQTPMLAGFCFPLTGAMLVWAARRKPNPHAIDCRQLSYTRALLIGLFQALAILPGISRSGATIVAGLGCGLKREEAAAFSFLLAIPAIAGAGLLEILELAHDPPGSVPVGELVLGAGLSCLVGLAALAWLIRWLRRGRLHLFAWWVLLLGPAVILWQLITAG